MSKQELIDKQALINKLLELPGVGSNSDALDTIKRFPTSEPQKPVIPQFVADYIEELKGTGVTLLFVLREAEGEVRKWLNGNGTFEQDNENQVIFARAWSEGYEVEKEPLYMVPLLTDKEGNKKILVEHRGEYDIIWAYKNDSGWHELLTKEQIMLANPVYWKLAVLYETSEEENE